MNIEMTRNETELNVALEGRLDTLTAPELEKQLEPALNGVEKLVFDFKELKNRIFPKCGGDKLY